MKKALCLAVCIAVAVPFLNYFYISAQFRELRYDNLSDVPTNEVGLLLGTAKYMDYENKVLNPYFVGRIKAAVELYKAKKVKKLLASGSRVINEVNELKEMKQALMDGGVAEADIMIDAYGDRTLYSVIRAKESFRVDTLTLISQEFHNERALFMCNHFNVKAVAYNAQAVRGYHAFKNFFREVGARMKMAGDLYFLNTQPYIIEG